MKYGILLISTGIPVKDSPEALRQYAETVLGTNLFTTGLGPLNSNLFKRITIPAKARAWKKYFFSDGNTLCEKYLTVAESLRDKLSCHIATSSRSNCITVVGFRCGNPSIASAVNRLKEERCDAILTVPLYSFYFKPLVDPALNDARRAIEQVIDEKWHPTIKDVVSFCEAPGFARMLARRIEKNWHPRNVSRLLVLMPSQPRFLTGSDKTFEKQVDGLRTQLDKHMKIGSEHIHIAYVSDFDNEKWTGPFAEKTLLGWIGGAVRDIRAVSPVFCTADPLGTFDAGIKMKEFFLANSIGKPPDYQYIPSFDDNDEFVKVLGNAICKNI